MANKKVLDSEHDRARGSNKPGTSHTSSTDEEDVHTEDTILPRGNLTPEFRRNENLEEYMRNAIVDGCAEAGVTALTGAAAVIARVFAQMQDGKLGKILRGVQAEVAMLKTIGKDVKELQVEMKKIKEDVKELKEKVAKVAKWKSGAEKNGEDIDTDSEIDCETSTGQPRSTLPKIFLNALREHMPLQSHLISLQVRTVINLHMKPHLCWNQLTSKEVKQFIIQVQDAFQNGKKISPGYLRDKVQSVMQHYRFRMRERVWKALWKAWDGSPNQEIRYPQAVTEEFLKTSNEEERRVVAYYKAAENGQAHTKPAADASDDAKATYATLTKREKKHYQEQDVKWTAISTRIGKPDARRI